MYHRLFHENKTLLYELAGSVLSIIQPEKGVLTLSLIQSLNFFLIK